jgi:hypothetical protein
MQAILTDYRPQTNQDGMAAADSGPGHFPGSIWLMTGDHPANSCDLISPA